MTQLKLYSFPDLTELFNKSFWFMKTPLFFDRNSCSFHWRMQSLICQGKSIKKNRKTHTHTFLSNFCVCVRRLWSPIARQHHSPVHFAACGFVFHLLFQQVPHSCRSPEETKRGEDQEATQSDRTQYRRRAQAQFVQPGRGPATGVESSQNSRSGPGGIR